MGRLYSNYIALSIANLTVWLVSLVILTSCQTARTVPADIPAEALTLAPGETLRIQIPPDTSNRPEEANPTLYLTIILTDEQGNTLQTHTQAHAGNQIVPIRARLPGYAPVALDLRFRLRHSRHFVLPLPLVRVD